MTIRVEIRPHYGADTINIKLKPESQRIGPIWVLSKDALMNMGNGTLPDPKYPSYFEDDINKKEKEITQTNIFTGRRVKFIWERDIDSQNSPQAK